MTTRRNVLLGIGVASVSALALKSRAVTVSRPGTAFGTTVNITATAQSETLANHAIDGAYAEIRAVHKAASLFDPHSEVSTLNANGFLRQPTNNLREIISWSDQVHHHTSGAFDPSIQPLWQLWSNGNPDPSAIATVLRLVGWKKLETSDNELRLQSGAALSFNGIAQGYAADRVMKVLRHEGVLTAMIDTGEAGRLNSERGIAIQHPRKPTSLGAIMLRDGFAAVSGDYATTFSADFAHHHIFDPRLGFSPQELSSVAVVARTGAMADGLATAFMVMGTASSLECLKRLDGCSALFVDKAGAIAMSEGMKPLFQNT